MVLWNKKSVKEETMASPHRRMERVKSVLHRNYWGGV